VGEPLSGFARLSWESDRDSPPRRRLISRLVTERTVPESQRRPSGSGGPDPMGGGPTIGDRDLRPCENKNFRPTRLTSEAIKKAPTIFSRKISEEVKRSGAAAGAMLSTRAGRLACRISPAGREARSFSRLPRRLKLRLGLLEIVAGGACQAHTGFATRNTLKNPHQVTIRIALGAEHNTADMIPFRGNPPRIWTTRSVPPPRS